MVRTLIGDLRYAIRVLRGSPGPTAVAVLTLALGIAANTTVFGWIDALLMHPISGAADGGRLAAIETVAPNGTYSTTAYRDYRDYRDSLKLVSGLGASLLNAFNLGSDDNPQPVWGEYTSGNYFAVLGVRPMRGRTFLPEEFGDKPGAFPVAVIGEHLWRKQFHSDPQIVGKTIRVNRYQLTIVGVVPAEFRGSVPGLALDVWVPMVMAPEMNGQGDSLLNDRGERQMWITARLKPGVTVGQARAEVMACSRRLAELDPNALAGYSADLMPVWKAHIGIQAWLLEPLRVLMAVCFVLFLLVGANVANLQLARATTRQREFAVRRALGAGSVRLARQLLAESLLLAALGAAAGIPLALWLGKSLVWLMPPIELPIEVDIALNADILGFAILLCAAAAVVTGLAPIAHSVRANLNDTLKAEGRSATSGAGLHRTRGLLVVSEVALALVALVGTGLFARSFQNARAIHPGFDARNVLFSKIYVEKFCRTTEQRTQFSLRLHDRIMQIPGVRGVSYSTEVPLEYGSIHSAPIEVEGYVPVRGESMEIQGATVAPGFFDVLRIPLLEGRDFTEQDDLKTPPVAIVNQSFARRFFHGANPVGRKIGQPGDWHTIIGMAKDSKYHTLTEAPVPFVYTAFRQAHGAEFWIAFFVRTPGREQDAIGAVRREAAGADPGAGAIQVIPFTEKIAGTLYQQKVAAALLGVLGGISLLLAAVGLYSVMAYSVSRRTHEFGIRMALGARSGNVLGMVIRQAMLLTLVGVFAGGLIALAAARGAAGLLVNISAADPAVFVGAALFLGAVAVVAASIPAYRATKVDPVVALRHE
jgi:predicted permease